MELNKVFFYQGKHNNGANFYYDEVNQSLSVVTTHAINFDNDMEGLHLKKLDNHTNYKTMENVTIEAIENSANELLAEMDNEYQSLFQF